MKTAKPKPVELLTMRAIADELGVPVYRVRYVLSTRQHIQPIAKGCNFAFYGVDAIASVRHEINSIDAHRDAGRKPRRRNAPRSRRQGGEATLWT